MTAHNGSQVKRALSGQDKRKDGKQADRTLQEQPIGPCHFLMIPQELQDKIYNLLFTNRELAIMRTSKVMYERSKHAFTKAVALDIKIPMARASSRPQYGNMMWHQYRELMLVNMAIPTSPSLTQVLASKSANLRLCIDFEGFGSGSVLAPLKAIAQYAGFTGQDTLTVTFMNNSGIGPVEDRHSLLRDFAWAAPYKKVIAVVLSPELPNFTGRLDPPVSRARNRKIFKAIKEVWTPMFGPWKWYSDVRQEDTYLVFYPRAHCHAVGERIRYFPARLTMRKGRLGLSSPAPGQPSFHHWRYVQCDSAEA